MQEAAQANLAEAAEARLHRIILDEKLIQNDQVISKFTGEHKEHIDLLQQQHAKCSAGERKEHRQRIESLLRQHEERAKAQEYRIGQLIQKHDLDIKSLGDQQRHREAIQKVESKEKIEQLALGHRQEVEALEQEHGFLYTSLREEARAKVGYITSKHEKKVEFLRKEHDLLVARIQKEHQKQGVEFFGHRLAHDSTGADASHVLPTPVGTLARKHGESLQQSRELVKAANKTAGRILGRHIADFRPVRRPDGARFALPESVFESPATPNSADDLGDLDAEDAGFKVGDQVEVYFKNEWSRATIHRCLKEGKFCVTHADGTKEYGVLRRTLRKPPDMFYAQPKKISKQIEIMEEESTIPTRSTSEADFICGLSGQHLHLEKVGVVEMTGIKAVRQSVLYQTILEVEYNAIFKSRSYLTPADQGPIKISRQHGSASFTAP